jgi:tetratricopeptide (TPR) repeat protein
MPSEANLPAQKLLQLAARSLHHGHLAEAEAHLRNVLLHDPANTVALHHLALRAYERHDYPAAQALAERALTAEPGDLNLLTTYGTILQESGQPREALNVFLRLLSLDPTPAPIWNAAGICLRETGQPAQAVEFYLRAIGLQPGLAEAHSNLGAVLYDEGDTAAAISHYRHALTLKPDFPDCLLNLGIALRSRFEYDAAIDAFRAALRLRPANADFAANLGEVLGLVYDPQAVPTLRKAVSLLPSDPEKHWNLALAQLKFGDYTAGFQGYEWRWRRPRNQNPLRPFPQPFWRGEPISGQTLLVHAEQGFGDTLQFLRYVPLLLARDIRLVLEVQPGLHRLTLAYAAQLGSGITVVPHGAPLPPFDWHVPTMSLAAALQTRVDTIPPPQRFTPPAAPRDPRPRPLRIGIAWSGNPAHQRDRERSVPTQALLPLFAVAGCTWTALQPGPAVEELRSTGVAIDQPPLHDFLDTANLIDTLDLVLAVDTAVAHLAASQGAPTWLMLPFAADWRWLAPPKQIATPSTPWYPQARVFRQTRKPAGEPQAELWQPVIAELAANLLRETLRETPSS